MRPTRYFTGRPCPRGHISERMVSNRECVTCLRERTAARNAKPEIAKKMNAARYWKDPEKSKIKNALSRRKHIDKRREYDRIRYQDPARMADAKTRAVIWAHRNKAKRAGLIAAYRAAKKHATPPWLTKEQRREMREFYIAAAARDGEWHVDHIVPLKGMNVCGLHVPWNLQIITGDENRRKGNKNGSE